MQTTPYPAANLGFSSAGAFWSQVGVFISEYPHQVPFAHQKFYQLPLTVETLGAVQRSVFDGTSGRVDLSGCLAWQRQFRLLDGTPEILSSESLLGRFREAPRTQEALRNLAALYVDDKTPLENTCESSVFIRRRLDQIRKEQTREEARLLVEVARLVEERGNDLVTLALKVHHEEALLRCDYHAALLSAFWLYGFIEGESRGFVKPEVQRENVIRIAFANTADALNKDHWERAVDLVGFSLTAVSEMEQSRLLETNAWFADSMKPRLEGLDYIALKERLVLPRRERSPKDLQHFIMGLGFSLLLTDPARYRKFWPSLTRDFPAQP